MGLQQKRPTFSNNYGANRGISVWWLKNLRHDVLHCSDEAKNPFFSGHVAFNADCDSSGTEHGTYVWLFKAQHRVNFHVLIYTPAPDIGTALHQLLTTTMNVSCWERIWRIWGILAMQIIPVTSQRLPLQNTQFIFRSENYGSYVNLYSPCFLLIGWTLNWLQHGQKCISSLQTAFLRGSMLRARVPGSNKFRNLEHLSNIDTGEASRVSSMRAFQQTTQAYGSHKCCARLSSRFHRCTSTAAACGTRAYQYSSTFYKGTTVFDQHERSTPKKTGRVKQAPRLSFSANTRKKATRATANQLSSLQTGALFVASADNYYAEALLGRALWYSHHLPWSNMWK